MTSFVIASEAKQSRKPEQKLDCFVAPLLAMTRIYTAGYLTARITKFSNSQEN